MKLRIAGWSFFISGIIGVGALRPNLDAQSVVQAGGPSRTVLPDGYEQVARTEDEALNGILAVLDEYIRSGSVCERITKYQFEVDRAVAQAERVRGAWKNYYEELVKKYDILSKTAQGADRRATAEREQMEDQKTKLKVALEDLQRRLTDLPPGTPEERKTMLRALVKSTESQVDAMKALLAELEGEFKARRDVASLNGLTSEAYHLLGTATDQYHWANKLLIDVRYGRAIDRCVVMPQSPRK